LAYSPNANRIFSNDAAPFEGAANVTVINPQLMTVVYSYDYSNVIMMDCIYNSINDTIWVWYSGSTGEFFDEYDASGSAIIASHSVSTDWGVGGIGKQGFLAYNPNSNHIIMMPSNYPVSELSYSIYDCNTNAVLEKNNVTGYTMVYPVYVSTNNSYYISSNVITTPTVKIDASTFSQSVVTNMTASQGGFSYVPEVDKLFGQNLDIGTGCAVFDPSTNNIVTTIPGIISFYEAIFDPMTNCVVISDGASGGSYDIGGGLCYVDSSSYLPVNFISLKNAYALVYCDGTSTVLAGSNINDSIFSFPSSYPTGSLPQPDLPAAPIARIELVDNGGFESNSLAAWTQDNMSFTTVTTNATYVHSGSYGLRTGPDPMGFLSQSLATIAGNTYNLTFWLYADGGSPTDVKVYWEGVQVLDIPNGNTGGGFQQYSASVNALVNGSQLVIGLFNSPSYFGLDDISVI
jgi:hypothetical protein